MQSVLSAGRTMDKSRARLRHLFNTTSHLLSRRVFNSLPGGMLGSAMVPRYGVMVVHLHSPGLLKLRGKLPAFDLHGLSAPRILLESVSGLSIIAALWS